ncbi:MAG: methanol--corrinoid methyltransferase, partial [Lentisphaerae bacterium]
MKFKTLAIENPADLRFGFAPNPVKTRRGLEIGNGNVYPELNLTVPAGTVINRETLPNLQRDYREAVEGALKRAIELHVEGMTVEFETLLEMTVDPHIGVEITRVMSEVCDQYHEKYGLKCEIRLTPNDCRDFDRPPKMRTSQYLDGMFTLFEQGALAGGDLLSIESTGGKEICDEAITMCNLKEVIFALSVLGVRDMKFLWSKIVDIAKRTGRVAGGDTACGFANTAMVLAEMNYI